MDKRYRACVQKQTFRRSGLRIQMAKKAPPVACWQEKRRNQKQRMNGGRNRKTTRIVQRHSQAFPIVVGKPIGIADLTPSTASDAFPHGRLWRKGIFLVSAALYLRQSRQSQLGSL